MSKGDTTEGGILGLIFEAETFEGIAEDYSGSPATTVLDVALHTADPGEGGTQSTNEASYPNYARQSLARGGSPAGWVRDGNSVSPAADISFPEAGALADETITHASIGFGGTILYRGAITPEIVVASGVTPKLLAEGSTVTED